MRKKLLLSGMLAWLLTFGLLVAGCDNDGDDDDGGGGGGSTLDTALVAKWYSSQAAADAGTGTPVYEFKSDGTLVIGNSSLTGYTYSAAGGKITLSYSGTTLGTGANYAISGTVLTISNAGTTSGLSAGTYYKKAN
jgi:hypothetical protein